jgi:hypothetical protein
VEQVGKYCSFKDVYCKLVMPNCIPISISGVYFLKCLNVIFLSFYITKVYVGQSGRSIKVRHKEHVRYIRTNNPISAYALHILEYRYEYRTVASTLQLLKGMLERQTHELFGSLI